MPLRVILAAEEAAGIRAVRLLAARGHEVVAVLTDSSARGLGATVAGVARGLRLQVRPAELIRDRTLAQELSDVDLLLNVHSLHIAAPEVIASPRLGAFNLHPGPLPEYAGLHVVSWAIYNGEQRHGVTLHRMTSDVDAGAIAYTAGFPITAADTGLTVTMRCVREGLPLIERLLTVAQRGEAIPATPQDLARRRWFPPGPPEGGRIHWDRPARRIADLVRAADYRPFRSPWGTPRCLADGEEIAVLVANAEQGGTPEAAPGVVGERRDAAVVVAATDGWVRVELVRTGGRELEAAAVLAPGQQLSS